MRAELAPVSARLAATTNQAITRWGCHRNRLVGLSLMRVLIGGAGVLFYLSDYGRRELLWGPHAIYSLRQASSALGPGLGSLYLVSSSEWWFELVFHAGLIVAVLFTVFGGRPLTFLHAVFLWSIYERDPQLLEGGDNLARILIIFMLLVTSNAYLAPGARRRRTRLEGTSKEVSVATLLHNAGVVLIIFQVATVYFWAGYWKLTGTLWQHGDAMYYISRITQFQFSGTLTSLMTNPYLTTLVSYFTTAVEVLFPLLILNRRAWVRKSETLAVELLHLGIILGMGLACFGTIMLGADSVVLRDDDYRSVLLALRRVVSLPRNREALVPIVADETLSLVRGKVDRA